MGMISVIGGEVEDAMMILTQADPMLMIGGGVLLLLLEKKIIDIMKETGTTGEEVMTEILGVEGDSPIMRPPEMEADMEDFHVELIGMEEREAPKERPRLNLAPRSKPAENEDEKVSGQSSIFGGAKPVDTLKKEMEIEERHKREKEEKERAIEEAKKNKPSAASIFGSAKPVDTSVREKEIEEKLSKLT